jgi:hypothetical protein
MTALCLGGETQTVLVEARKGWLGVDVPEVDQRLSSMMCQLASPDSEFWLGFRKQLQAFPGKRWSGCTCLLLERSCSCPAEAGMVLKGSPNRNGIKRWSQQKW